MLSDLLDKLASLHKYKVKYGGWPVDMTAEEYELVDELYRRADEAYGRPAVTPIAFDTRVRPRRTKGDNE